MRSLPEVVPVEHLLLMEVEELAGLVLMAAKVDGNQLHQSNFTNTLFHANQGGHKYHGRNDEVEVAIAEAWNWLEVQGLLIPAPGTNGANGWKILSRRAKKIQSAVDVTQFAKARRIPKELLHPRIADKVWAAFIRAEFDVAAFLAMKAVEIYVREAGGFGDGDLGTALMRSAFHEDTGPLTDKTAEKSERQARSSLFAGAIGCYKNPHSHRDVDINEPDEAMEIVLLANHLLRIVDGRLRAINIAPP
ncbi:TIGR02391 family protein [Bradyrhizobium sp. JYMT SZCCT0428]|uniref:TIGR02391 family protein n=1 Tax=Bradyrhizobium sp. JYMT SZCCT0428 TaxID=2807673 RepID=UPI001BAC6CBB|nr:TIGR02391 family protein [Bradyrhizobium sp. JYMT SZCCT0428]MBR1154516.1 TIGR02391 family protein [Bradyrhizobium sp. JYMT SZCCT0428]